MTDKSFRRLFTPGPLNTSRSVKQAMLVDMGSREDRFLSVIAEIRGRLLHLAGVTREDGFEVIPMQGSGTFGIESVLASTFNPQRRLLVVANGAYGRRIHDIARYHRVRCELLEFAESELPDLARIRERLVEPAGFTDVAAVHCETSTGILNPIQRIGQLAHEYNCCFLVDAMSSFGGVPLNMIDSHIDVLISSSNKCLQGVPGFSFVIARRDRVLDPNRQPTSLSLNLGEQLDGLERNGQFRFTPPTHAMLAFQQALIELEQEGGVAARAARYHANQEKLVIGMRSLGFREYLPSELQSNVITTFLYPETANFDFAEFYLRLSDKGMVIYPGKLTDVDCFRVGCIGHLFPDDIQKMLDAIEQTLHELNLLLNVDERYTVSKAADA